MKVVPNPMTVGDYVTAVEGKAIRVNDTYQRGGGIWSPRAKSALIETVILGYPMPALFLHQLYDRDTRKPYRDLVDGQQRTDAIEKFASGNLVLSSTLTTARLRRRKLSELDEEDYRAFITYSLPIFLFTDASEADVREAFRRINSHTSVLNAEERRHSRFQGAMKWFVLSLSKEIQSYLSRWSVYNEQKLIRMQDARFTSELILAIKSGIGTVKEKQLDDLYQQFDDEASLPDQDAIRDRVLRAFRTVGEWEWIRTTPLVKPYQLSMLLLAVMHANASIPAIEHLEPGGRGVAPVEDIESRLGELVRALESADLFVGGTAADDEDEELDENDESINVSGEDLDPRLAQYADFIRASSSKTNTADARTTRFRAFYQAVAK
jgi:hypothetical protein